MRKSRIGVIAAAVTGVALVLAGCSTGPGDAGDSIQKDTSVTVAQNSAFYSNNPASGTGNSTYNSNITYMTTSGFNYYDDTPKLVKNEKFGTYTKVSDDPLTIKYTVNEGVKWSDGVQVGAADMLLSWASQQSKYNDEKGVNFAAAGAGLLDLVSKVPAISDDGRSVTLVYDKPYVDWEVNFGIGAVAAHAAYTQAFPDVTDGAKANDAVIKAIQDDDTASLTKIATAWGTKFDMTDLPKDKSLYLSFGPYVISQLVKDSYVTLVANKDYNWGPLPKVAKITVRFIQDPTAQVQALQNGEISVINGQADADTVNSLKDLKDVTSSTDLTSTYEHIDLTFNNKGPFDPATYGGDAAKALAVRQAFLKVLPRQEIIDKIIKPVSDLGALDNSQTFLPGADGYDESVASNGSADYATVDADGAKALLEQAGVKTPVKVDFMYGKSNTRRAAEFALIQASAKLGGFDVVDDGDDDWGTRLGNGSYDAALFAWQFTSLAVTGTEAQLKTGGGANYSGYSNSQVDDLFTQLDTETDPAKAKSILEQVDKILWGDAYGVTLFQHPNVTAYSNDLKNIKDAPLSPNVFWNFFDWEQAK